jgi:hypothetical protein
MARFVSIPCFLLLTLMQVAAQQQPTASNVSPQGTPVPTGTADFNSVLSQLEQSAQTTSLDLAHLRIEKWKGERSTKEEAQSKADSLEKNLSAALPAMISAVRNAPGTLAPALKLYRNMNVVYDVLVSVTESAGAFGSKAEFKALAADTDAVDEVRRALADVLESMAATQDAELARARTQSRPTSSTVKKIVVDENEPVHKPVRKKKSAAPPAAPAPKPQ